MQEIKIGQLVISKAGRDKGNHFLVIELAKDYVYLVDGKTRRIDQPKKKKIKHIQPTHWLSHEIAQVVESYDKLSNADVQNEIKALLEKM
ncbi:MAG: KOW domain-containing RNA-binding protein [Eubacteriales bacterium]|nr:KOW domain-containing RNA-binding protein [Eubacteriales bacterium]